LSLFLFLKTMHLRRTAAAWGAVVLAFAALPAGAQSVASAQERFVACLACHGEGGRSTQALIPSLAGQPSFYAITQLFLFREGRRGNPLMTAMAKGMSDDDMRAFSELIEKLPPPPAPAISSLNAQRMTKGATLAQQHRCASCHGTDYAGGKQVARLANQREDYLAQTLKEFLSGKRVGYTSAMNEALAGIAPEALADLAYFLANIPATTP
jgi:cytochrome c553